MWESFWLSSAGLIVVICFLPETSPDHILYRRAQRLRRITGNDNYISITESNAGNEAFYTVVKQTSIKAITLNFNEPVVLVLNTYLSLVFSLLFAALESYVVVFVEIYGFTSGQEGLTFLGPFAGFMISLAAYCWFYSFYQQHQFDEQDRIKPEQRLIPAFVAAVTVPLGLFLYGWGARPEVHWIVPVIGGSFMGPSTAGLFFAIMNYLPDAYPSVSSTVLAGNSLMRCSLAATFPIFITPMYHNLGPGWASTVWGVLGCLYAPVPIVLYLYGGKIRQMSKEARKDF